MYEYAVTSIKSFYFGVILFVALFILKIKRSEKHH
jgi:hypothetical protein